MAELFTVPKGKRKRSHSNGECVFCMKPFSKSQPASQSSLGNIDNLLSACQRRSDDVGTNILQRSQELRDGKDTLFYHNGCRSTYVSKIQIERYLSKRGSLYQSQRSDSSTASNENAGVLSHCKTTRSQIIQSGFDFKSNCFVCGLPCHAKKKQEWSMVESSISDSVHSSMFSRMKEAAEKRNDNEMIVRLSGVHNGDLVAVEARYHRKKGCYSTYINPACISAALKVHDDNIDPFNFALEQLLQEFMPKIADGNVFLLSTLRSEFCKYLCRNGISSDNYTSQNLKSKLQEKVPELCFISQPGHSDLVCCRTITVGDALRLACTLLNSSDSSDVDVYDCNYFDNVPENVILHRAVGILRENISQKTERLQDEYFSSREISLSDCKKFVGPQLLRFIMWLTDKDLFDNADVPEEHKKLKKCVNIACDIVTLATGIFSPKHLGISVDLYHSSGSRKMVENIHLLGYGISYTELRRFLTSAAAHIVKTTALSSVQMYMPPDFVSTQNSGGFIACVADNWDHNEKTTDGKRTTHAMTSILIQNDHTPSELNFRVQRLNASTLNSTSLGIDLTKVVHYKKSNVRPEPILSTKIRENEMLNLQQSADVSVFTNLEIIYMLSRSGLFHSSAQLIPLRNHYRALTTDNGASTQSIVSFCPILMANPTDFSTVYTTLLRFKEAVNKLGQEHTVVCFDLGLLTKALEIVWSKPVELSGVIPIEGGMHFMMSLMAALGHIYGDSGIRLLLHDSGVYAAGTVQQMLSGKDYDRGIRGFKLVDEVLTMRLLMNFQNWCERNEIQFRAFSEILSDLESAFVQNNKDVMNGLITRLQQEFTNSFEQNFNKFREDGRKSSPTFKFWDDFLFKVMCPMKNLLTSTRVGNWTVQQASKAQLLPLIFAANRTNYARYMTVQLLLMNRLPEDVARAFREGNFVARLTKGNANKVWLDYTIETTENKALKGLGGIIGLTLKGSALERWFLSRPISAQYAQNFEKTFFKSDDAILKERSHRDSMPATLRHWTNAVQKMLAMFDKYIDPFDLDNPPEHLVNFATGAEATTAVEESLLGALEKGSEMMNTFVSERFDNSSTSVAAKPIKSFYDPLQKSNIKTMTDLKKKTVVHDKNVSIDGEIMYLRLMAANARKNVAIERVMSFENAPVPLSLFTEEGIPHSCKKSEFMHCLEKIVTEKNSESSLHATAVILDGHALIQSMPDPCTTLDCTFFDLAKKFVTFAIHKTASVSSKDELIAVHLIFDKYHEDSIKGVTRNKRSDGIVGNVYEIRAEGKVPNWKRFLSVGKNKSQLAEFLTNQIVDHPELLLQNSKSVYVSGGVEDNVFYIIEHGTFEIEDLRSNHEEADTRMILHAIAAAQTGSDNIVVFSPDTDVLVLLIHHRPAIKASKIYLRTNQGRSIPVHDIYDQLTELQLSLLLPVYCITGCDTVSSFFGHGKKSAFRLLRHPTQAHEFVGMSTLGETLQLTDGELEAAKRFVAALYGEKRCPSLNYIRAKKAASKKPPKCRKLPPTDNSFHLHVLRVVYQLYIWRSASTGMVALPNSEDFGYEKLPGRGVRAQMMSQPAAVPELLNDIICNCVPGNCVNDSCPCVSLEQPCTPACACSPFTTPDDDIEKVCGNPCNYSFDTDEEDG